MITAGSVHAPPLPMTLAELSALSPENLAQTLANDAGHTARWVYEMACHGLVEAQTILGQMLLDGRGTPADAGAARRWFLLAAEAGHAPAANMLGRCLERGWGGEADYPRAAHWYRQAAAGGLDWGQYNLANMLLRGRGVDRDMAQSFTWFVAAAKQGHAKSMNLVGRFLEDGWLGPPDIKEAALWYRRAAEGGDFRGQYNLASLLVQAGHMDEAVAWFIRSGETGSLDFRRLAAGQLLERQEAALRQIGLAIAAGCCDSGDGEDYHRYGVALAAADEAQPRQAAAWLRLAVAAGYAAAAPDLERVETALKQARPRPLEAMLRRITFRRAARRA